LVLSPTGLINLGFITGGRLVVVLITPSLGVPNWSVIYINTAPSTSFLAPLPGRKKTSARGVSNTQSFTLFLCNIPRFYQILGEIFFGLKLFVLIEISQGFKTF
jgi:hypothetical protein